MKNIGMHVITYSLQTLKLPRLNANIFHRLEPIKMNAGKDGFLNRKFSEVSLRMAPAIYSVLKMLIKSGVLFTVCADEVMLN